MKPIYPNLPEDAKEIAEQIRTGEFFRESLQDYRVRYDDLISDRYFFLLVTVIAALAFLGALVGIAMLHPLKSAVPITYFTNDIMEEVPSLKKLGKGEGADPNLLLKWFLTYNYVTLQEEYSIDTIDRNANGIKSQSAADVFDAYQSKMDPRNPDSPIAKYQRLAVRQIDITSVDPVRNGQENTYHVYFTSIVSTRGTQEKTPMRANITFRFDDIKVDQKTGDTTPLNFVVTNYSSETLDK